MARERRPPIDRMEALWAAFDAAHLDDVRRRLELPPRPGTDALLDALAADERRLVLSLVDDGGRSAVAVLGLRPQPHAATEWRPTR